MMTAPSGSYCTFGQPPVPAHIVTHRLCDEYPDGTVQNTVTGEIITRAPAGAPRGVQR